MGLGEMVRGWVEAFVYKGSTLIHHDFVIVLQEERCCSSGASQPNNECTFVDEMIGPYLCSWIEQEDRLQSFNISINGSDVSALAQIAIGTGVGQIVFTGESTVLLSNDVIDMKWDGSRGPRKHAVLATMHGSGSNEINPGLSHAR
jgi:hypothetical protein